MFRGHHGWRGAELPPGVSRVGAEGPRGSHRIPRGCSRHAAHGARGVPGAFSSHFLRQVSLISRVLSLICLSFSQNYEMLWSSNEHTKGTMGNFGGIQPYWLMWCMSILDLYDATGVTSIPHPSLQATPSQHDSSDDPSHHNMIPRVIPEPECLCVDRTSPRSRATSRTLSSASTTRRAFSPHGYALRGMYMSYTDPQHRGNLKDHDDI